MTAETTSRTRPPVESETEAAFGHAHDRRHRDDQIKFFTIAEVATRLQVAPRTIRRWVTAGDLVVHRVGAVVRISERDLRSFLAFHREG